MGKLIASGKPSMMSASKDAGLRNLGRPKSKQASMLTQKLDMGGLPDNIDDPFGAPKIPSVSSNTALGNKSQNSSVDDSDGNQATAKSISAIGDFASGAVDALDQKNAYGARSEKSSMGSGAMKGAGQGAEAGAMFGAPGMVIGAGVGALVGAFTGKASNARAMQGQDRAIHKQENGIEQGMLNNGNAKLATMGSQVTTGSNQQSLYARRGGMLHQHTRTKGPTPAQIQEMMASQAQAPPGQAPPQAQSPQAPPVMALGGKLKRMAEGGVTPPTNPPVSGIPPSAQAVPGFNSAYSSIFDSLGSPMQAQRLKQQVGADQQYNSSTGLVPYKPQGAYDKAVAGVGSLGDIVSERKNNLNQAAEAGVTLDKGATGNIAEYLPNGAGNNGKQYPAGITALNPDRFNAKAFNQQGGNSFNPSSIIAHEDSHNTTKGQAPWGAGFQQQVASHQDPGKDPLTASFQTPTEWHARADAIRGAIKDSGLNNSDQKELSGSQLNQIYTNPKYKGIRNDMNFEQMQEGSKGQGTDNKANLLWNINHASLGTGAKQTAQAALGGYLDVNRKTAGNNFPENKNTVFTGNGSQQPVRIPGAADKLGAARILTRMDNGGVVPGADNMANKQTKGGSLVPMSKHTSMVQGPSHEGGGVSVPAMNAEVEGGETTSGNFVFSKELGFADQHKPIAKALGASEKQPDSLVKNNTIKILKGKEQALMQQQEQAKAQMGMPNDAQAVAGAPQTARKGGMLKKYADGGQAGDLEDLGGGYTKGFNPLAGINLQQNAAPYTELPSNTPSPELGQNLIAGASKGLRALGQAATSATPFMADAYNLHRQLPNAPAYQEEQNITPNLVDYSASRQEAQNQSRVATRVASRNLGSGAEIAAVAAANSATAAEGINKVNEQEQTTNTGLKNAAVSANSEINKRNLALRNASTDASLDRTLVQGNLHANALASIGTKMQEAEKVSNTKQAETNDLLRSLGTDRNGLNERDHGYLLDRYEDQGLISHKTRLITKNISLANTARIQKQEAYEKANPTLKFTGLGSNKGTGSATNSQVRFGQKSTIKYNAAGQEISESDRNQ